MSWIISYFTILYLQLLDRISNLWNYFSSDKIISLKINLMNDLPNLENQKITESWGYWPMTNILRQINQHLS